MIDLPDPDSVYAVADWVELTVAATGERLPKSLMISAIEGTAGQEPPDHFVSSIWRELDSRRQLYKRSFFIIEEDAVESRCSPETTPEYLACLLLSLYGVQGDTQLPPKLFERLVRLAMERYLNGSAVTFGWPFEEGNTGDNETVIKRKIKKLADDALERFCETPAARFKDRGVDVVGWIPFGDQRSGQTVILLQCAAGHNWENKLPAPVDAWCQYIHWACNPIKAFAVPCIVSDRDWHEKSKDKGMLFDRVRILNLLPEGIDERPLNDELKSWVTGQLSEMR